MDRLTERYTPELVYLIGNGQTYNIHSRSKMAKALDRLASYEDTGLTPEEAAYFGRLVRGERMVTEQDLMESGVSLAEIQRLMDIITAEAEGRLLVLPCKVGDTVYWLRETAILPVYIEWFETNVDGWCACGKYPPMAAPTFKFEDFGKTVFLTREEAEAALKKDAAQDTQQESLVEVHRAV